MQKNIQLIRDGTNPWGFRVIGGVEFKLPLTVVMIQSESAAEKAGLQNGDEIMYINGTTTQGLTHGECHDVIVECGNILMLTVTRGPFDNHEETAFQPIEASEDIDHMFQPSEVPDVRSNTASPFQPQTKPYRPFSTEPIVEVPPLESPIILNPNYQDEFPKISDEDVYKDTIFKLPISPQYVGLIKSNEKRTKMGFKCEEYTKTDFNVESIEKNSSGVDEIMTIDEIKFGEKMKTELDITKIEETASIIVEESIEKAISVTEEIKTEIDVELHEITSKTESKLMTSMEKNKRESFENSSESTNNIANNNKTIEKTQNTSTIVKENKECNEYRSLNKLAASTEVKSTNTKKDLDVEKAVTSDIVSEEVVSSIQEHQIEGNSKTEVMGEKNLSQTLKKESLISQKNANKTMASQNEQKSTETKETSTTSKLLAEQRAYILGLQTIPNIRGRAQSSYHQDMLLKTFFIHLTDVMVALSRIILYERPLSKYNSKEDLSKDVKQTENIHTEFVTTEHNSTQNSNKYTARNEEQNISLSQEKEVNDIEQTSNVNTDIIEFVYDNEIKEQRVLSGSKMAQMTSKKSEELIEKMDAVVIELQNNVETENIGTDSINKQIVINKNTSINNTKDKEDILSQVIGVEEIKSESAIKSITSKSIEMKQSHETKHTQREKYEESNKTSTESNAQTYIAIVEAHVYTNKEAIINKESDISKNCQSSKRNSIISVVDNTSIEEEEIKEDNVEITFEDAIAKSNIAIITCEPIIQSTTDILQDVTISSRKLSNVENETAILLKDFSETSNSETFQNTVINETELVNETNVIVDSENMRERNQYNLEEVEKLAAEYGTVSVQDATCDITLESNESKVLLETECTLTKEIESTTAAFKSEGIIQESSFTAKLQSKEPSELHENILEIHENSLVNCEMSVTKESMNATSQETKVTEHIQTNIESNEAKVLSETKCTLSKEIESTTCAFESEEIIQESSFTAKLQSKEPSELHENILEIHENSLVNCEMSVTKESMNATSQETKVTEHIQTNIESNEAKVLSETKCTLSKEIESTTCAFESEEIIQESSFTAKLQSKEPSELHENILEIHENSLVNCEMSVTKESMNATSQETKVTEHIQTNIESEDLRKKLSLDLSNNRQSKLNSQTSFEIDFSDTIKTPTPSHVPPTPLTDEYMFRLEIPLKESELGTIPPIEEIPNPVANSIPEEHEDPNIVKKKLIPHIETSIESIIYDTPIASPLANNNTIPAFIEHGLRSADDNKEDIIDIERKSSLLASAIDETIKTIKEYKEQVGMCTTPYSSEPAFAINSQNGLFKAEIDIAKQTMTTENNFKQESIVALEKEIEINDEKLKTILNKEEEIIEQVKTKYDNINGEVTNVLHMDSTINGFDKNEIFGTSQGIINGMEDTVIDNEIINKISKPGMTEEKIAELISGEAEMLREAHVMGLKRVLASHMTKPDDSSVDFMKIKPIVENLKDSEVLKALNDEFFKTKEEREKNHKKWTTFLQKPKRPVPKIRFGYYGYVDSEEETKEPYKVKIVKQPKPKVAPDYKSEDFETGPLPWEQRAASEPSPPPIPREDPILVPEELPQFLEAVDPLPESEVPDLEDTGIPLPPPKEEVPLEIEEPEISLEDSKTEEKEEVKEEEEEKKESEEEQVIVEDMEQNRIAQEILGSIQNMVDPKATVDQQLQQMRAQLATLAQLPVVIQQSLELVTKQLSSINVQEISETITTNKTSSVEISEVTQTESQNVEVSTQQITESMNNVHEQEMNGVDVQTELKELSPEEIEIIRKEEMLTEEQRRAEKDRKLDQESRQIKQRPTPRVGKPKPVFGPLVPQERPLVLPGGRKWRKPRDAYNEEFIAETLTAQAEIIQGKAKGYI